MKAEEDRGRLGTRQSDAAGCALTEILSRSQVEGGATYTYA